MAMQSGEFTGAATSVLRTQKTIEYHYLEPVREVVTRLRLFPDARRGAQRLLRRECEVWPRPDSTRRFEDDFGNEVWEFCHAVVTERLLFSVGLLTAHAETYDSTWPWEHRLVASHGMPAAGVGAFLGRSPLVDDSEEIRKAARRWEGTEPVDSRRVAEIGEWVHGVMCFEAGVTTVETPASVALAQKSGVCQDYAHVMLAICRTCGIPARYVSGFIPGEGYMHAWVEALVTEGGAGSAHWTGFDPTHNRRPDSRYLAVALGRDYADVSPVTGSFYGSAPGRLISWSETVQGGTPA
jgi:transglutaminase-like putative cysteine protease